MKTKNQIIDYLQISSEEYDIDVFDYYFKWCETHGKSHPHVQELMANARIDRWFMKNFEKLEQQYIDALPFIIKTGKNLKYEYQAHVGHIFTLYPKPLIDAIKIDLTTINNKSYAYN